ncbi:MAG TPA: bifunctional tetrahydrofolate synthase/dihydrofolate synthase [Gammaproteobacteria bacterium]|nr:bifunctional tetrahydrofolate synthase/dihydrofolate synthase [Gammaproteobacteria bacterium]
MRFNTLAEWLDWQETLNPAGIELGLKRVQAVLDCLGHSTPPFAVVTVGGTNGKGSSVAMLESILLAGGYQVGCYTSPHLLRYNERVRIQGREIGDDALCAAFERVDQARGDIPLTYFEFGTLAAIDIFVRERPDIVLLEVGLGGRLDAVNVLDSDVALVTSVGIDHQEWLGPDRESIGREKAGIFRPGRAAVCGDPDPPASLLRYAQQLGATLYCAGRDFGYRQIDGDWCWWEAGQCSLLLPLPALRGAFQLQNAAAVLMVLMLLKRQFPLDEEVLRRGLVKVTLPGRFQIVPGKVTRIFDVGHNPHAAAVLADTLAGQAFPGRTLAVVGMLADKDHEGMFRLLCPHLDAWYAADLHVPRGADSEQLSAAIAGSCEGSIVHRFASVTEAYRQAMCDARSGDRVVVFGSFHTVAEVLPEAV